MQLARRAQGGPARDVASPLSEYSEPWRRSWGGNLAACAELGTQSYTFVRPRFSFTRVVSVWDGVILSLPYGRAVVFLARERNC